MKLATMFGNKTEQNHINLSHKFTIIAIDSLRKSLKFTAALLNVNISVVAFADKKDGV